MSRLASLSALLFAPIVAAGLSACAGRAAVLESPNGPPYAPLQLTSDDLGTWDVELTGRAPMRGRVTVRGVETNTVGCNGSCIVTRVDGELAAAVTRNGGGAAWWQSYDAAHADTAFKQTGLRDTPSGSSSDYAADPVSTALRAPTTRRGLPAARTSVEYLGANRRVVTIYGVNDRTIQSRIVYTRRR